ncbi:MAG: hypothetical protein AAF125_19145 [Chloroflexota bacterium]
MTTGPAKTSYSVKVDDKGIIWFRFTEINDTSVTALEAFHGPYYERGEAVFMLIDTNNIAEFPFARLTQNANRSVARGLVLTYTRHAWVIPITPISQYAERMLAHGDHKMVDAIFVPPGQAQHGYDWLLAEQAAYAGDAAP